MTSAHNVWDWKCGLAISIRIHRDNRVDPYGLDDRCVKGGAVHYKWATEYSGQHDFAILQVAKPFDDKIRPMKYRRAPPDEGILDVQVHGFVYDTPRLGNGACFGHLWHSSSKAQHIPSAQTLLHHSGDTKKGMR